MFSVIALFVLVRNIKGLHDVPQSSLLCPITQPVVIARQTPPQPHRKFNLADRLLTIVKSIILAAACRSFKVLSPSFPDLNSDGSLFLIRDISKPEHTKCRRTVRSQCRTPEFDNERRGIPIPNCKKDVLLTKFRTPF